MFKKLQQFKIALVLIFFVFLLIIRNGRSNSKYYLWCVYLG